MSKQPAFSEVHHFKIPKRTEGDGMEKEPSKPVDRVCLSDQLIYRPVNLRECSLPPTPVTGKIISLTPKVKIDKKNSTPTVKIPKEPKFVPYEPYKAATNPIFQKKDARNRLPKIPNNSEANIADLLQMRKLSINELTRHNSTVQDQSINDHEENPEWKDEKQSMLEELSRLRKENAELENQVKYQAQVNAEIKKLLVAAVGEDIETRVQLLAEDKLHLAKQLLNTARTLSTHQEQIEWLAGQGEVWRSKFLSSSMLVEDLARWKAGLCHKLTQYGNVLKSLLEDNDRMRRHSFQTFINLNTLHEKFNLDVMSEENEECQVVSLNLVNLCASNYQLSELLLTQLLRENIIKKKFEMDALSSLTSAEKEAEQTLAQPMITFRHTDIACSAVMTDAAIALSSASPHCSHCNGTVKTV